MASARVILLVVDQPAHRVLFNRALNPTPHHLVFTTDGEDAFDRYPEVKPNLVISHLYSPRLDGGLLCQLIRQRLGGTSVPYVLIGDQECESEGLRRATEVEADLFLTLPMGEADLRAQLEVLLEYGRSTTDIRARPLVEIDAELDTNAGSSMETMTGEPFSQVDDASTEAVPFDTTIDTHDLTELPPETNDVDTVISHDNPFFDSGGGAQISGDGALPDDPVTQVAIEAPEFGPTTAQPVLNGPVPRSPSHIDPLEEPRINTHPGPGPSKNPATASRLIAEVPRERTPTGDSGERLPPAPGNRRGLDESQLGKRLAKRVRAMYRLLEDADFYQLLDLPRDASYDRIRRSYYELSLEFHPDRFFLLRSGDLKEKIYAIYRRVAEAFQVLGDERTRQEYDHTLQDAGDEDAAASAEDAAARPSTALGVVGQTDSGQRYIELASAAFESGDYNHARLLLMLAQACERENPSLEAGLQKVIRSIESSI